MVFAGIKHLGIAAPVIFEVVHAPGGPGLGILFFVVQRTQVTAAGTVSRTGVNAQFEAVRVQPVSQGLHIREFFVGGDGSVGIAFFGLPGIVDVDIRIAVIGQSPVDKGGGRCHHLLLGNAQAPAVPAVPAHRRRQGYLRTHLQGKCSLGTSLVIGSLEHQRVFSHRLAAAAQNALVCIQHNALRKAFHRKLHRSLTRESQAENDRGTGTDAKYERSIVARSSGSRGREDIRIADTGFQPVFKVIIGVDNLNTGPALHRDGNPIGLPGGERYLPAAFLQLLTAEDILLDNRNGSTGF